MTLLGELSEPKSSKLSIGGLIVPSVVDELEDESVLSFESFLELFLSPETEKSGVEGGVKPVSAKVCRA